MTLTAKRIMAEKTLDSSSLSPSAAQLPYPPASVSAVSVKIPPFWSADPEVWFVQVEAQFSTRNITSQKTMFDHVIAALAPEIAMEIRDLLLSPPDDHPYDVLRTQLIKRTAASEQRRLQQLLTSEELGDKKPSQLLRRMQQFLGDSAGPNPDNKFLRELFLQRLPSNVRMVLASAGDMSMEALAQLADKIMEVATPTVSAVHISPLATEVEQLRTEIAHLKDALASLQLPSAQRHTPHSRPSSRAGSRSSSPTPTPAGDKSALCWYHRRFGDRAKKCVSPCNWSGNAQARC